MRGFASRGLYLEQHKEPAISNNIEGFYEVNTVFLPVSDELCVSPEETLSVGKLVSKGIPPKTVDSFSSINGVAVAVGGFDFEKFKDMKFLQIDATSKASGFDRESDKREVSDEDIVFACEECGIINTTDKKTLKEICETYRSGVETIVIEAVDDEP